LLPSALSALWPRTLRHQQAPVKSVPRKERFGTFHYVVNLDLTLTPESAESIANPRLTAVQET